MSDKEIVFLHFSDLHMKLKDDFGQNTIFDALWKDIKKFVPRKIIPDFIAFTGDVANSGKNLHGSKTIPESR